MTHAVANALAYNTAYQLFTRVYTDYTCGSIRYTILSRYTTTQVRGLTRYSVIRL